jgi:hypothetical protein
VRESGICRRRNSRCSAHLDDAVTTYGDALLAADRKRLNETTAIRLRRL